MDRGGPQCSLVGSQYCLCSWYLLEVLSVPLFAEQHSFQHHFSLEPTLHKHPEGGWLPHRPDSTQQPIFEALLVFSKAACVPYDFQCLHQCQNHHAYYHQCHAHAAGPRRCSPRTRLQQWWLLACHSLPGSNSALVSTQRCRGQVIVLPPQEAGI